VNWIVKKGNKKGAPRDHEWKNDEELFETLTALPVDNFIKNMELYPMLRVRVDASHINKDNNSKKQVVAVLCSKDGREIDPSKNRVVYNTAELEDNGTATFRKLQICQSSRRKQTNDGYDFYKFRIDLKIDTHTQKRTLGYTESFCVKGKRQCKI
jgi:hypothetical protein